LKTVRNERIGEDRKGPEGVYAYSLAEAQPWLKSWGGPRFGSKHRGSEVPEHRRLRLTHKGRAGCWVRERVALSRCQRPGVSPPENFWKLRC